MGIGFQLRSTIAKESQGKWIGVWTVCVWKSQNDVMENSALHLASEKAINVIAMANQQTQLQPFLLYCAHVMLHICSPCCSVSKKRTLLFSILHAPKELPEDWKWRLALAISHAVCVRPLVTSQLFHGLNWTQNSATKRPWNIYESFIVRVCVCVCVCAECLCERLERAEVIANPWSKKESGSLP